jgi:anti-sigma factor RsiW
VNCRKVSHLLSAYMDGELPGVEHRMIHQHLGECSECQAEYQVLLRVKRLLSGMRLCAPRPELPQLILERVATEQSRRAGGRPSAWVQHLSQWWRQVAPPPPMVAFGAGLVMVGVFWTLRVTDAQDGINWKPASAEATASLPSLTSPDLNDTALDTPWQAGRAQLVGATTWSRPLSPSSVPVTVSNQTLSLRPVMEPVSDPWSLRP